MRLLHIDLTQRLLETVPNETHRGLGVPEHLGPALVSLD